MTNVRVKVSAVVELPKEGTHDHNDMVNYFVDRGDITMAEVIQQQDDNDNDNDNDNDTSYELMMAEALVEVALEHNYRMRPVYLQTFLEQMAHKYVKSAEWNSEQML